MADLLSKDEVEALLQAVSKGQVPARSTQSEQFAKSAVLYDFSRPTVMSEDQSRQLRGIHESFGRHLSEALSEYVGLDVEARCASLEQQTYREFESGLPTHSTLLQVGFDGDRGRALLALTPRLGLVILDRLLGGPGTATEIARPFSEVEQELLTEAAALVVQVLQSAWREVVEATLVIESRGAGKFMPPHSATLSVALSIKLKEITAPLFVCYPIQVLDWTGTEPSPDAEEATQTASAPQTGDPLVRETLEQAPVEAVAKLGAVRIRLRDVVCLREGDVLLFDRHTADSLDLEVGNRVRFKGSLGRHKNMQVFSVRQRI